MNVYCEWRGLELRLMLYFNTCNVMKTAALPTSFIYIRAFTLSPWDACNFAILHLSPQWLASLRDRLDLLSPLLPRSDFYSLQFWDAPLGYFVHPYGVDTAEVDMLHGSGRDWCFVEVETGELECLTVPEAELSTHQLVLNRYGYAGFTALGNHSDEAYLTADFNVRELLNFFN